MADAVERYRAVQKRWEEAGQSLARAEGRLEQVSDQLREAMALVKEHGFDSMKALDEAIAACGAQLESLLDAAEEDLG